MFVIELKMDSKCTHSKIILLEFDFPCKLHIDMPTIWDLFDLFILCGKVLSYIVFKSFYLLFFQGGFIAEWLIVQGNMIV